MKTRILSAIVIVILSVSGCLADENYHWKIRKSIIANNSAIVGPGSIVMIGDSITEMFFWRFIAGKIVLNAGFAGAKLDDVTLLARELLPVLKAKYVVLMIGINDCTIGNTVNYNDWGDRFENLLDTVHAYGATPIVLTILPVEEGKPLGSEYFDVETQRNLNRQLYYRSVSRGETVINLGYMFAPPPYYMYAIPGYTSDGVHPSRVGMVALYYALEKVISGLK